MQNVILWMVALLFFLSCSLLLSCGPAGESKNTDKMEEGATEVMEDEQNTLKVYQAFLSNLAERCGQSFVGKAVYPQDEDHEFYGQPLLMTIALCEENQVHIPLQVGENRSRTWMLEISEERLSLKHDHRHEDGTPEELTMYGGFASGDGTEWSQFFPADEETAKMLPEAATNVWNMVIYPEEEKFEYILHRHGNLRFHAVFDWSKAETSVQN